MNGLSTSPDEAPAMRLPRFRFSMRGMMVAVAIVVVALGVLATRSRRFQSLATDHRARVMQHTIGSTQIGPYAEGYDSEYRQVTQWLSDWHHAMAMKYQLAAGRPWLPIPPDPPPNPPTTGWRRLYSDGYRASGWSRLRLGMRASEVEAALGRPLVAKPSAGGTEVWTYSQSPGFTHYWNRDVHFRGGRVEKIDGDFYVD
jgi:hypothetical protein